MTTDEQHELPEPSAETADEPAEVAAEDRGDDASDCDECGGEVRPGRYCPACGVNRTNESEYGEFTMPVDDLPFTVTTATINYAPNSVLTRWPCAICGGHTDKQDPMAEITLPSGSEGGFACDACATADQDTIRRRLITKAQALEKEAAERRAWAGHEWRLGTTEQQVRDADPERYEVRCHQCQTTVPYEQADDPYFYGLCGRCVAAAEAQQPATTPF
jgi:hypothetical protein